jgi:hypothetical protein
MSSLMNISWRDLNNADQPGEYRFHDGTITVSFAEIATWKKSQAPQFQLMRKNPIKDQINYVLGKRFEPRSLTATVPELRVPELARSIDVNLNGQVHC